MNNQSPFEILWIEICVFKTELDSPPSSSEFVWLFPLYQESSFFMHRVLT